MKKLEIKGKYNTAKVFTNLIDDTTTSQLINLCNQEFVRGSKIRIMPDCHSGKGCVVGTTITIIDKVVPHIVGVDIGCGVSVTALGTNISKNDLKAIDDLIRRKIPAGKNVHENVQVDFPLKELKCYGYLKDVNRILKSIGTLGGGNHFISIEVSEKDKMAYLLVHSGSRNLGKQVAEYYQELAIEILSKRAKEEKEKIIEDLKKIGKAKDIQSTLKKQKTYTIPKDFAYLTGKELENYLHDMDLCKKYAEINRSTISNIILREVKSMLSTTQVSFDSIHNYIDIENMILRKGAVSAQKGEIFVIPLNMRDGSLICRGKGNPDWNYSAPHGAGRLFSRSQAKKTFSLEDYQREMQSIYSSSVNQETLDECPMAYKPMESILENIFETAEVVERLNPVYNFKGGG